MHCIVCPRCRLAARLCARLVQLASHDHRDFKLAVVVRIEVLAVRDVFRNLPAAPRVFEHKRVVKAELAGGFERGFLGGAVDKQFRSHAGMAIHPFAIVGGEVAAQVRQTLLKRVNIVDLGLLAAKHGNDVVEDFGIKVLQEQRIEVAQLVKESNLWDGRIVTANAHVKLFDVLDVQVFPKLVAGLRQIVFVFKDFAGKRAENSLSKKTWPIMYTRSRPRLLRLGCGRACRFADTIPWCDPRRIRPSNRLSKHGFQKGFSSK